MKNLLENAGKIILVCLMAIATTTIAMAVYSGFQPKEIKGYYLSSTCNNNIPTITVIIDNRVDQIIWLPPTTTYEQAIEMVDKLNATVKK